MHIEVMKLLKGWYWHFRAKNGNIVSDAEAFPTKANAMRAAKAVVKAVVKPYGDTSMLVFKTTKVDDNLFHVTWS